LKKFKDLIQRKIYGWAMPELTEAILITSARDPKHGNISHLKLSEFHLLKKIDLMLRSG
jgi:hypothetical protein